MSVATLYNAFTRAAALGTMNGAILPLMGKLVRSLGVEALTLNSGVATRLPASARLTGTTTWPDATGWTVDMTGTVDGQGRDVLTMTLQARTPQGFVTLGTLVSDLPLSRVPSPSVNGVQMLGSSVLAGLGPEQAAVTTTAVDDGAADAPAPLLAGWLVLAGTTLAPYASVMGANRFALTGSFDPRASASIATRVNLAASAPAASTDWAGMDVTAVGLSLTTDYVDPHSLDSPPTLMSTVLLVLTLRVDTGRAHLVTVTVPLLQSDQFWDINGSIDPPLTLFDGVVALLGIFPGASANTFQLPAGVAALDAFGLSHLRFGVETSQQGTLVPTGIGYTSATVVSTSPWDLPIPFIRIEQVGASWLVFWTSPKSTWTGSLFGTMRFGSKTGGNQTTPPPEITGLDGQPIYLDVAVSLPDLQVAASTRGPIAIGLGEAMSVFFPGQQPDVGPALVVDQITMIASIPTQTYGATLTAHGTWLIPIGDVGFSLDAITFDVTVSQAKVWGGLQGLVGVMVAGEKKAQLSAGAYYPGDGTWLFQGGLAMGTLNLVEFAYAFLGQTPPAWLDEYTLELTQLWAEYSTGPNNPYAVSAALAARWAPVVLGINLSLVGQADIRYRPKVSNLSPQAGRDALKLQSLRANAPRLHEIATAGAALGGTASGGARDGNLDMVYEGAVKGAFTLNNLTITVGLSFISQEMTWLFRLQLDRFSLEARTAWTGTGDKRHQVLTVLMEGVTLGAMVESFAALANPNANYRLAEPWTFLNSINLGRFTLVIDPTEQSVTLDYAISLKLGFITIKTVGIRYDRKTGEPQVNIEITGNFLGKEYGREPGMSPLGWDALNDSPPSIPGAGNQLVALRYLGFGQHVSLTGLTRPDSMAEIIRLMREQLRPTTDPRRNPLDQPSGNQLHFDESSQWLIGLDATLMGTATVKLVMHDPDLYGVLIALAGPQAGALAGFSFELLYKKVSDDIGVFHARLQVPDMFRQIDFGVVAITLGIITVDVYTNGNFKVDLGFPHGRDFSVSFGLQYGPFLGKGGIYFGLLNGTTSTRVPAITNGNFSPVLELGIGLAVGIGREFNKGPLKAGLYVQLEVVFEGVLAWFHPDDAGASTAMYYWAQGTAALVGRVYGKVDFKVISVDVNFEAYAAATLTLACYRPTLIEMHVGVRVHASVKVLFVRVSFSFSTSLDVAFTVGSASTPPWVLAADQSGRSPGGRVTASPAALAHQDLTGSLPLPQASRSVGARQRRRPADMARLTRQRTRERLRTAQAHGTDHPLMALRAGLADDGAATAALADPCSASVYRLDFSPTTQVYAGGAIQPLDVRLVPGFTIADMPVSWPGSSDPPPDDPPEDAPAYRVVVMLAIDGPVPVAAPTLAAARTGAFTPTARAAAQEETPFATLAEGLFRWAVSAIGLDPQSATLTAGDLAELAAQMDCPQTFADGFAFDNLNTFLANNVSVRLSGPPAGDTPDTVSGVSFPMPPVLGWTSADLQPPENQRDFALWQPVDDAYAARIAAYFSKLSPQPRASGNSGNSGDSVQDAGGIPAGESLASVIFREYLLLITKSMVQAAQNLFARFPMDITTSSTLTSVADGFDKVTVSYVMHLGDTVDQVAATYGYGRAELLALNPELPDTLAGAAPGSLVPVVLGVTPESIAAANPQRLLAAGKTLAAHALEVQVRTGDTPATLCTRVGASATAWLATPAALDVPAITLAGATLTLAQAAYANPSALTLTQVAALFYVRRHAGTAAVALVPESAWYGEAITQITGSGIGADGVLPATIYLPTAYDVIPVPPATGIAWTRLAGDTLALLAATTALWQNPQADPLFASWLAAVEQLNPGFASGPVNIPAGTAELLPHESLRALAARLLMVTDPLADPLAEPAAPSAAFITTAAATALLLPLASAVVTDCSLLTEAGQTLDAFASTYDLAIETVGRLGADVAGLIVPDATQPLIVPTVAAMTLATLMPKLTGDAPVRDVAGQVSRFMLHGQRLPIPGAADDAGLAGLYDLVGQQVTGPAPDSSQPPDTARLTLTLAPTVPTPWLTLVQTETVSPAARANPAITAALLAARNPAAAAGRVRPGMILETADTDTLVLTVTEAMLEAGYPASTLAPVLPTLPQALQLWEEVPVRHGLPQMVIWQVATRPGLPSLGGGGGGGGGGAESVPAVGMPSLWPFTADLAALAARGAQSSLPWQLYRTDPEQGPAAPALPITRFAWATLIDIRINRIPGRPHTAEVTGADTAGRQLLLALWQYLQQQSGADTADLFFGWQLSPAAGLAGGLASSPVNADATYLVRTNLSTETRSGNQAARRSRLLAEGDTPPSGPYFAPLSDALGFLTLLWEASVVGGGGYWLDLTDADGNGFSEDIWGPDGNAVITLVSVLESQASANPSRALHSFNTAALVGDPVDTSATALFVAAPDDRDTVRRANVAQGNVGFTFGLTQPPDAGDSPDLTARRLYSLCGYQLQDTAVFDASHDGQPVNPLVDGGGSSAAALRMAKPARAARDAADDADSDQTLTQVIPIHRFAKAAGLPLVPGLPLPTGDPYAGISAPGAAAPPVATVVLGFHDLFGNSTAPGAAAAAALASLPAPGDTSR